MLKKSIKLSAKSVAGIAVFIAFNSLAAAAEQASSACTELTALQLPAVTITLAEVVTAGSFAPDGAAGDARNRMYQPLPAFCRVAATLRPSADSDIKIEVWLPVAQWNGKYLAIGNGAFSGNIRHPAMIDPLLRGYATSSTDTGHEGNTASFGLGHPEKVIDFGWRSVHEMAAVAKQLITTYYQSGPRYSYWNGCSAGGRQALQAAQRFPADFDGIIAGAPGLDWTGRAVAALRVAQVLAADPAARLGESERDLLHRAALNTCDASDGVADGVIDSPQQCQVEPATLRCSTGSDSACLTDAQVTTANLIYGSAINPATGRTIPGLVPGSEPGWTDLGWTESARATGDEQLKYLVYQDPNWRIEQFDFDIDVVKAEQQDNNTLNALNADLRPFFGRGGKLLQYHGWSDPQISPLSSTQYYASVLDVFGNRAAIHDDYRLFMVPGMAHCGGGPGTDSFDAVSALEAWVENDVAPERIDATHSTQGVVDRARPLCPFPEVALWSGAGSTDVAENFSCRMP